MVLTATGAYEGDGLYAGFGDVTNGVTGGPYVEDG